MSETKELLGDSFPLDGVIRAAYIVSHIEKFLKTVETAEYVHNSLPKEMREYFDSELHIENYNEEAMYRLAFQLAKFSPSLLSSMKQMFHEIRTYVSVWVDDPDEIGEPKLFGMLDPNDMKVINEMVTFVQRLGRKSVRGLLQFLESVNDGDYAYLIIEHTGNSEIRFRYHISDAMKEELDLK